MVNESVRMTLAEDADDLKDADQRQAEPISDFEEFVTSLRNSGRLQSLDKPSAAKELQSISDKETLTRLIGKVKSLATQPNPSGSEKLAGRPNLYRVRQGNDRVIDSVDDETRVVDVVKVGNRRNVYQ